MLNADQHCASIQALLLVMQDSWRAFFFFFPHAGQQ